MFTFKKQPRSSGLAGIGETEWVDIKVKKKVCGSITGGGWRDNDGYKIRLTVVDKTSPIGWNWVQLKFRGKNADECREFLKERYESITTNNDLYFSEN